jgi:hypothetical protein
MKLLLVHLEEFAVGHRLRTTELDYRFLLFSRAEIGEKLILKFWYSVIHQFRQAKFAYGGSILSSCNFLLLPQPPLKITLATKVVKIDSKIIGSPTTT